MALAMQEGQKQTRGLRRLRARIRYGWAPNWPIAVGFTLLIFFAHFALGANSQGMPMTITAVFALFAAITLATVTGWARFYYSSSLALAGILFCIPIIIGIVQQSNWFPGAAHPDWLYVDGASAITIDRDATQREVLKLAGLAAAFLTGLSIGRSNRRAQVFYALFITCAGVYCLATFLDFAVDPARIFGVDRTVHFDRLSGTYVSANTAATLFGVFAIFAAARIVQAHKEISAAYETALAQGEATLRRAPIAIITLLLALVCLMLTASRGGVVITLVALSTLAVWEWVAQDTKFRKSRSIIGVVGLVCGLALVSALLGGGLLIDRWDTVAGSSDSRMIMMQTHWNAFLGAPVWGNGLGSFDRINDMHQTIANWEVLHRQNAAHNVYLQWLEEAGIVGAISMFACVLVVHMLIYSGLRRRARMRTWLRAQMAVSILIAVHAIIDYSVQVPAFALQWAALIGVAVGLASSTSQRDAMSSQMGPVTIRRSVSVSDRDEKGA